MEEMVLCSGVLFPLFFSVCWLNVYFFVPLYAIMNNVYIDD